MAQAGRRFPCPDHALWTRDLSALPTVSEDTYHSWCRAKDPSERQRSRAYRLATEAYCSPSSVRTNTCDSQLGIIHVLSSCFRSQKKSGRPYVVRLTLETDSGEIVEAACECPAGCSGACCHILAGVHLLVLLQAQGFKEAPPELACTELPQQWGRPRQQGIKPASVQDVDWRSPRENGLSLPLPMRLFDARRVQERCEEQQSAVEALGRKLGSLGNGFFASVLLATPPAVTETRTGMAPEGSPMSYQQAFKPHGFETLLSETIIPGTRVICAVPELELFGNAVVHTCPDGLTADEQQIVMGLCLTADEARQLEASTRQQSKSQAWHAARKHRLTSSTFGAILQRHDWTEKGLRNLLDPKDLSRVRPVQHGIKNESCAVERYLAVMHSMGHHVSVRHCGLVVSPSCPWLGASPDRLVFDPEEGSYGVIEVKCPYKLKESDPSTAAAETFCLTLEDGIPHLKRDNVYFFQVLGQMALTGCQWADFVVFTEKWVAVERIHFDKEEWLRAKDTLDRFFFAVALPYFTKRDR